MYIYEYKTFRAIYKYNLQWSINSICRYIPESNSTDSTIVWIDLDWIIWPRHNRTFGLIFRPLPSCCNRFGSYLDSCSSSHRSNTFLTLGWPPRLSSSFSPLCQNEIRLSSLVPISSSIVSTSLTSSSEFGTEFTRVELVGGWYHEANSLRRTSRLSIKSLVWGL
mgnify:CR=1 FL=1